MIEPPTELVHRRLDQPLDLVLHRDVGGHQPGPAAAGAQLGSGSLPRSRRRTAMTTAPSSATTRSATARPIPVEPPVTITTFADRRPAISRSSHSRPRPRAGRLGPLPESCPVGQPAGQAGSRPARATTRSSGAESSATGRDGPKGTSGPAGASGLAKKPRKVCAAPSSSGSAE